MHKIKIKYKKGSHVGIVLSFVIFVTFLAFFYSIIEPTIQIDQTKQIILNYLEGELINNLSAELTITTVTVNKTIVQLCVELQDLMESLGTERKIIVRDNLGNRSQSFIRGQSLQINRTRADESFLKIYYSEEFNDLMNAPQPCPPALREEQGEYAIRLTKKENYVFESKINKTLDMYKTNYEELKTQLNIPLGTEFGFSFINSTGGIIKTDEKNISTNVYVGEVAIQYIDSNANILHGFIDIKVW